MIDRSHCFLKKRNLITRTLRARTKIITCEIKLQNGNQRIIEFVN